jgi:hypothetical protein
MSTLRLSSGSPCAAKPSWMMASSSAWFHAYQREKPGPSA